MFIPSKYSMIGFDPSPHIYIPIEVEPPDIGSVSRWVASSARQLVQARTETVLPTSQSRFFVPHQACTLELWNAAQTAGHQPAMTRSSSFRKISVEAWSHFSTVAWTAVELRLKARGRSFQEKKWWELMIWNTELHKARLCFIQVPIRRWNPSKWQVIPQLTTPLTRTSSTVSESCPPATGTRGLAYRNSGKPRTDVA